MHARPTLLAALGTTLVLTGTGCPKDPTHPGECSLAFTSTTDASFDDGALDLLIEAAGKFNAAATGLDDDVRTACNGIAEDLGAATSEDTREACDNATAAIDAVYAANAGLTITLAYQPALCTVDAHAVAECTASCEGSIDVDAVPVTCEGGELSGSCTGTCEGSCTVEGTVECAASCSGQCSGQCDATIEGTCDGTCSGQCDGTCSSESGGRCEGTCTGTCRGTCTGTVTGSCSGSCTGSCTGSCRSDVTAACSGTCTGACSVEFVEPRCEGGEVTVEGDVECSGGCQADASFEMECTDPEVVVTFDGAVDATQVETLVNSLADHLPVLVSAAEKAGILVEAGATFATNLDDAAASAVSEGVEAVSCLAGAVDAQLQAIAKVQVSVEVTVEVKASAEGSASGGG